MVVPTSWWRATLGRFEYRNRFLASAWRMNVETYDRLRCRQRIYPRIRSHIGHPQVCLITPRRLQKIAPSVDHEAIQIVLYGICRKISYLVYESSLFEIKRGIAQDAVSGTCLECDKQLVQISVGHR